MKDFHTYRHVSKTERHEQNHKHNFFTYYNFKIELYSEIVKTLLPIKELTWILHKMQLSLAGWGGTLYLEILLYSSSFCAVYLTLQSLSIFFQGLLCTISQYHSPTHLIFSSRCCSLFHWSLKSWQNVDHWEKKYSGVTSLSPERGFTQKNMAVSMNLKRKSENRSISQPRKSTKLFYNGRMFLSTSTVLD